MSKHPRMSWRRSILLGLLALGLAAVPAVADPKPATPEWYVAEAGNWLDSTGRLRDQLTNPEYLLLRESQADTKNADPYRAPELWAPRRGRVWPVHYRNRYGALISGHVWAPRARGVHPAVVMVNGAGDSEQEYWAFAQDLAEHGYVVLTFDPQGAGASDAAPAAKYCDPNGAWRKPQEMGVREHGTCAGQNGDEVSATTGEVPGVAELVVGGHTGQQGTLDVAALYEQLEPNFVFGALDAYGFLVSRLSPVRPEVNAKKVAVMGHSLGAYAALLAGNGDRRFVAAVAMDSYAPLLHGIKPRVPTMFLQSEQELFSGPRLAAPPPTALHATRNDYPAFTKKRIPVWYGVLAGSTHQEFAYVGPEAHLPASSAGQRVASYYALAWLDRWVAGKRSATSRLLGSRFDGSIDSSSTGLGRWDLLTRTNRPHLIQGRLTRDALSRYYVSQTAFDGRNDKDLRN